MLDAVLSQINRKKDKRKILQNGTPSLLPFTSDKQQAQTDLVCYIIYRLLQKYPLSIFRHESDHECHDSEQCLSVVGFDVENARYQHAVATMTLAAARSLRGLLGQTRTHQFAGILQNGVRSVSGYDLDVKNPSDYTQTRQPAPVSSFLAPFWLLRYGALASCHLFLFFVCLSDKLCSILFNLIVRNRETPIQCLGVD